MSGSNDLSSRGPVPPTELRDLSTLAASLSAKRFGAANANSTGIPYAFLPDNFHVANLEHLMDRPIRPRGQATTADMSSFLAYARRYATQGSVLSFANDTDLILTFDFHEPADDKDVVQAGWGEHSLVLQCKSAKDREKAMAEIGQKLPHVMVFAGSISTLDFE
jgi:hypothetical protein